MRFIPVPPPGSLDWLPFRKRDARELLHSESGMDKRNLLNSSSGIDQHKLLSSSELDHHVVEMDKIGNSGDNNSSVL
jgi:hypothetical protein